MMPTNGPSGTAGLAPAMQLDYCVPVPYLILPSQTCNQTGADHAEPSRAISRSMSNETRGLESTVLRPPVANADNRSGDGKPVINTGGINHRPFDVQRNNR